MHCPYCLGMLRARQPLPQAAPQPGANIKLSQPQGFHCSNLEEANSVGHRSQQSWVSTSPSEDGCRHAILTSGKLQHTLEFQAEQTLPSPCSPGNPVLALSIPIFFPKIYLLFERVTGRTEIFHVLFHFPKWLQQPGRAKSIIWVCYRSERDLSPLVHILFIQQGARHKPGHTLNPKWDASTASGDSVYNPKVLAS